MSNFDATARIRVDFNAFTRAAQQAGRDTGAWTQSVQQLQNSLSQVERITRQQAAEQGRTLRLYQQIASAVNSYSSALQRLNSAGAANVNATTAFSRALSNLRTALSGVQGISQREFERLNRTLQLYERLARAVSTYANALNTMARINQNAERAQQAANREQERAARAAERAARATQQANVATIAYTGSNFALRSALQDIQGVYESIITALVAIPRAASQAAISQEFALAQIERVSLISGAALESLRNELRQLSEEIPISFEQLATIAQLGSQIGIANDELGAFTAVVAEFAATTDVAEDEAALLFGRIQQMSDVPTNELRNLASSVSEVGSAMAATENEILRTTESIATITRQQGFAIETTIGLAGALASLRVRPELSRGALLRVFNDLEIALNDAGDEGVRLEQVMGANIDELRALQQENPDEFFLRFLQALQGVDASGQSLQRTLRELGIINTRDIDTVQRLALNYDFVAESVDLANRSFAEGTFLQQTSQRVFQTTQAEIQRTANSFRNLLADIGTEFLPIINQLAQGIRSIIDVIGRIPGATQFIAIVGAIGASAAGVLLFRSALAGTIAAVAAFNQVTAQTGVQGVRLRTLLQLLAVEQRNVAASTGAAATAQAGQAAAMAASAGATTAAAGAAAGAARASTVLATSGRAVLGAFGPMGLAFTALSTAAIFLAPRLFNTSEAVQSLSEQAIEAAGGVDALQDAIQADTQAAAEGGRVYREITDRVTNFTGAEREAAEAAYDRASAQRDVIREVGGSQEAITQLTGIMNENRVTTERSTVAIGEQAAQWLETAANAVVLESALVDNEAALQSFVDSGVDLGRVLGTALEDPERALRALDEAYANLTFTQREARISAEGYVRTIDAVRFISPAAQEAGETIDELRNVVEQYSEESARAAVLAAVMDGSLAQLSEEALANAESFSDLSESLDETREATEAAEELMGDLQETIQGFGGPLEAWENGLDRMNASAQSAFEEAGGAASDFNELSRLSFDQYLAELDRIIEAQANWARNMVELSARLPADVAAELGRLGPEAAPLIQELVNATDEELQELIPRFRATTSEGVGVIASVIGDAIPTLEGVGGDAGRRIAEVLATQLEEEGTENIIPVISQLGELIEALDEIEASPEVILETLEAEESLQGMIDAIREAEENGSLDPTGNAELESEAWERELEFLRESANRASFTNSIGIQGRASIDRTPWNNSLDGLRDSARRVIQANSIGIRGRAAIDRDRWNRDRDTLVTQARNTATRLNSILSVSTTATVNVRYTGIRTPSQLGGVIQAADGGWVTGPGGPRQDSVPALLSRDEFVVNARAAREYGPLLEAINSFRNDSSSRLDTGIEAMSPNIVMSAIPRATPARLVGPPEQARAISSNVRHTRPTTVITVNNTYPRAEPTSTTINRSLAYAAALDGVG